MSTDHSTSEKRRRFLNPFTPTTSSDSLPSIESTTPASVSAPSSHPFSAGFQAKLKLSSLSRAAGSALTTASAPKDRSTSDTASRRAGKGHYRTHSSLAAGARGDGELTGAQVVRTPSDARRGVMKTHLAAMGAGDHAAGISEEKGDGEGGEAGDKGEAPLGVVLPFGIGASGPLGDVHAATAALKRLSSTAATSERIKPKPLPKPTSRNGDTRKDTRTHSTHSTSSVTPPSSMIGSAELPMMEECDRRISLPSPPPSLIVPIIAPPVAPIRPHRGLAKAPSLPTIVQHAGENGTPTSTHTRPLRIMPKIPAFGTASGNGDSNLDGKERKAVGGQVRPSHVAQPVPAGLTRAPSIMRKTSGRSDPTCTPASRLKPIPPPRPATRPSDDLEANVRIIDVSQRPAPTAEDDVLIKLEFAFHLSSTAGLSQDHKQGRPGDRNGAITLPIDIMRRAPSKLLTFIETYLNTLTVGSRTTARNSDASDTSHETRGSRPSMTDGESAQSSDVESAEQDDDGEDAENADGRAEVREMDAYGAEDILRNEYLKSLWIPSPTSFSFPPPPSHPKLPSSQSRPPPMPSPPIQHVPYATPPSGRARTRNQYTQHPSLSSTSALAYPAPSAALLPLTSSLSMRRRATYIALPIESVRGTMTEVRVLMCRDRAAWGIIVGRVVLGWWKWVHGGVGKGEKGVRALRMSREEQGEVRRVKEELEWAGMEYLVEELEELERLSDESENASEAVKEAEAGACTGKSEPSHSLAGDIAASLSSNLANESFTPPIPILLPTTNPIAQVVSSSSPHPDFLNDDEGQDSALAPSASLTPTPGRAPIASPRHTSMFHKPTQTPPVVPVVSVTPPANAFDSEHVVEKMHGEKEVSPVTPVHLTAYPFPDQAGHTSSVGQAANVSGDKTNVSERVQAHSFSRPPPRPAMSALRPESRGKSVLSASVGDQKQKHLPNIPVQGDAGGTVGHGGGETRPVKRASVIRFTGGRGVRRGGDGYF